MPGSAAYTDMKDSGIPWIGQMPSNWSIGRIKYNYYLKGRIGWQGLKSEEFTDHGPYLITGTDFVNGRVDWNHCYHITDKRFDEAPEIHVQGGDLLITKDGTIGKVAYIDFCPERASLNSHLLIVRPLSPNYCNRFLFWVLQSPIFEKYFLMSQTGSIMASLSQEKMSNFSFPLPSLDEQKCIAHYLDEKIVEVDSLIQDVKDSIEDYKKWKSSIIYEAVTKGLDPTASTKESGTSCGLIPSNWDICRLRNIAFLQNGISKSGELFGSGFPFVTYGDVYRNNSLPTQPSGLVQSTAEDRIKYSVMKGDIFFTRTSETIDEVGFACTCEETIPNATFSGFLIRARPTTKRITSGFAKYYFRSLHHRDYFAKEMNLVTRASLSQSLLNNMPVLLPPIKEQEQIATFLDRKTAEIESVIRTKQSLISDLESYKKSLIYEVVTGKRKVV